MNIFHKGPPSKKAQIQLEALREAVAKELEKKRRLGHYYVVYQEGKIVCIGEDAPKEWKE